MSYQTECCICKDWKGEHTYFTPTLDQRREHYFDKKRLSHGFCPECYIMNCKAEGFDLNELEMIVLKLEEKL